MAYKRGVHHRDVGAVLAMSAQTAWPLTTSLQALRQGAHAGGHTGAGKEEKKRIWERCGGGAEGGEAQREGEAGEARALPHLHTSFLLFFCSFTSFSEFDFMPSTPSKVYDGSL